MYVFVLPKENRVKVIPNIDVTSILGHFDAKGIQTVMDIKQQSSEVGVLSIRKLVERSGSIPGPERSPDTEKFESRQNNNRPFSQGQFKLYKSRWWMMFIVVVLNISNALMLITFATKADTFVAFYRISTFQLNILSMTFMIVSIPVGFFASWVLDMRGLRTGLKLSAWLNGIGGFIRNASHFSFLPKEYSFTLLLTGQVIAACAQPFITSAPAKLAALWFPESRRATANMIGWLAKVFGFMTAFLLIPLIVKSDADIPLAMYSISIPAWVITLVTTFGVHRSKPPSPPSPSAGQRNETFRTGLKQEFTGLCGTLMLGTGLLISPLFSIFVDKTKKIEETYKIGYSVMVLAGILFTQVSRLRDQHIIIAVSLSVTGGLFIAIFPVALELSVEVSHPVAVATSTGLCVIGGQLQGIVIMFAMQYFAQSLPNNERHLESGCYTSDRSSVFSIKPQDWTYANLFIYNLVSTVSMAAMVIFLKPKYKRLETEGKILAQNVKSVKGSAENESKTVSHLSVLYSTRL